MYQNLKRSFSKLNDSLNTKLGVKKTLEKKLLETNSRLEEIERLSDSYIKASLFLQTLSDTTRQQVIDRISSIVTDALQNIKDPNLEFKMVLSTERNQVDLSFYVVNKESGQEYDILNSCGGSIADIVSFPLKFSLLMKWTPTLSRLLILDENFKFVSVSDQEPLGEFVRQISEKLGLQIILVTHSPTLSSKANKIFQVSQIKGVSKVEDKPS